MFHVWTMGRAHLRCKMLLKYLHFLLDSLMELVMSKDRSRVVTVETAPKVQSQIMLISCTSCKHDNEQFNAYMIVSASAMKPIERTWALVTSTARVLISGVHRSIQVDEAPSFWRQITNDLKQRARSLCRNAPCSCTCPALVSHIDNS